MTVFILGVGYIVYYIKTTPGFQDINPIKNPPADYLTIFPAKFRNNLVFDYGTKAEYDNATCQYIYDKNFLIQEFAINTLVDKPLTEFIRVENKNELNFTNEIYSEIRTGLFTVSYKSLFPKVVNLKVSLYGNPIKTVTQNDTLVAYSSCVKNLSIKHDGSAKSLISCRIGIYSNVNSVIPSSLPINIMFIKRKKIVYFLLMSIKDSKTQLEPDMLYNLMTAKL